MQEEQTALTFLLQLLASCWCARAPEAVALQHTSQAMVAPEDPRVELAAFAKLIGEGVEYYVRKYEIILGRASKSGQTDVVLGDNMNISRQHAKIVYNFEQKAFELIVLGKNGVTVGTTLYTPASNPCQLKSQDLLMVADKVFHFLLPKPVDKIRKREFEALTAQASKRPRLAPPPPTAGASAPGATAAQQPQVINVAPRTVVYAPPQHGHAAVAATGAVAQPTTAGVPPGSAPQGPTAS